MNQTHLPVPPQWAGDHKETGWTPWDFRGVGMKTTCTPVGCFRHALHSVVVLMVCGCSALCCGAERAWAGTLLLARQSLGLLVFIGDISVWI